MKANKDKIIKYLHMVQGQLKGIEKMIENNDYCIEISNQVMASTALLNKINSEILSAHLKHCVLHSSEEERKKKIDEIDNIIRRMGK